jgi:alpha-L-fucosidase
MDIEKMTSRREFVQLATRAATAAMLASAHDATPQQKSTQRASLRRGLPLVDLQQRFVDLRFGMFLHFNMATFQDREWGDPTSSRWKADQSSRRRNSH